MSDKLYNVNLDAATPGAGFQGTANTVRGDTHSGSEGGSDVGANEQEDQRVRDLLEQYLRDPTIIDLLNSEVIVNNPSVVPCATDRTTELVAVGGASPRSSSYMNAGQWSTEIAIAGITTADPIIVCVTRLIWLCANGNSTTGMSRTIDGGATWAAPATPPAGDIVAFSVAASGGRIWCLWNTHLNNAISNVSYSDDNGDTWVLAVTYTNGAGTFKGYLLDCHPSDPNTIVAFVYTTGLAGSVLWYSTDKGVSWTRNISASITGVLATIPMVNMWLRITSTGRVVLCFGPTVASATLRVIYSDDFGVTWSADVVNVASTGRIRGAYATGQTVAYMYTVSTAASPRDHRLMMSTDNGATFAQLVLAEELQTFLSLDKDVNQMAPDELHNVLFLSLTIGGGLAVVKLTPVDATGAWLSTSPLVTGNQTPLQPIPLTGGAI